MLLNPQILLLCGIFFALASVFLSVAKMGFKSATPLFWTITQSSANPAWSTVATLRRRHRTPPGGR